MFGFSLGTILGVGGLLVSAAATVGSLFASSKATDAAQEASDARQRANKLIQKKNDLSVRREKLRAIRASRIARATAVSRGTQQGAIGSVRGGFGSIVSQGSSNLGFLKQTSNINEQARGYMNQSTIFANESIGYQNQASMFRGVGSLAGSIFDNRKALTSFAKDFGWVR